MSLGVPCQMRVFDSRSYLRMMASTSSIVPTSADWSSSGSKDAPSKPLTCGCS